MGELTFPYIQIFSMFVIAIYVFKVPTCSTTYSNIEQISNHNNENAFLSELFHCSYVGDSIGSKNNTSVD